MDVRHAEILALIKKHSGKGTQHTLQDSYLGTTHPRYEITAPVLRKLARDWMLAHQDLDMDDLGNLVTSLIEGPSATEKMFAGMLLDRASREQGSFHPKIFINWLDHLEGWAEVDSLCTGQFTIRQVIPNWKNWKPLIKKMVKNNNIHKRRAALVLLCSPLSHDDNAEVAAVAFDNIKRLKEEREGLITKAISWLLRSMIKHHRKAVEAFINEYSDSLPKIAVRETLVKLKTGKKTKKI
jgi:3-methyladenine DNA glycosylase AlkD